MRNIVQKKDLNNTGIEDIGIPDGKVLNFAALSKLVLRDLSKQKRSPSFYKYTKAQISTFIKDPATNEKQLREAMIYIYNASSHFKRLIKYFAGLTYWYYVVIPNKINTSTENPEKIKKNWQKTVNLLSTINIKSQFTNILTICLREDVFYGTIWAANDSLTIQQLPSDYCQISSIEGNVPNVSFDFSYFNTYSEYLPLYPAEFATKFSIYEKNANIYRWQELDSPNSFAIKTNSDIMAYPAPPFSGILEDLYNLIDYKSLQLAKTELENYAMLILKLGRDKNDNWDLDFDKALEYWSKIDSQLPDTIGSALSPMAVEKITFDRTTNAGDDKIVQAQNALFSAAGVSSQIFNSDNTSSNALLQSIKADQSITYEIVTKIEAAINRYLMSQSYSKNFRISFLDISRYNQKEMSEAYYKACTVGAPFISMYMASLGMDQMETDGMLFLENNVLGFGDRFIPLRTSYTQSGSDGGRPEKDADDLSDGGSATRENDGNDR